MPTFPSSVLDALTGLPKKKAAPVYNNGFGGEPKNDTPFTSPIIPGTTTSTGTSGGFNNPLSTTIPGFTPDYAALIAGDPIFGQTKTDLAAQGVQDVASRNAAINRALVQFGALPDFGDAQRALGLNLGDIVNPETAGLAANNQFSTEANIERSQKQAISQLRRALAARGGLQSGELGYQLDNQNHAYGQAQNDAHQKLLDYIGGAEAARAEYARQQEAAARQAATEAAARQVALNPPTGSSTADFAYVDANGIPVYRHPGGGLFNLDGTPYNGPGQAAPTASEAPAAQPPATGQTGIPLSVSGSYPSPTGQTGIPLSVGGTFTMPNAYTSSKNKRG